jgi:hypothetical protein
MLVFEHGVHYTFSPAMGLEAGLTEFTYTVTSVISGKKLERKVWCANTWGRDTLVRHWNTISPLFRYS